MNTLGLTQRLHSQDKWPLYNVAQTRSIETEAQAALPAYTLMQRAGLATAQLALPSLRMHKKFGLPAALATTAATALRLQCICKLGANTPSLLG